MYAMIPGWSPQVGIIKPLQKADARLAENNGNNPSAQAVRTEENANPNLSAKKPFFSPNALVTNLGFLLKISRKRIFNA